MMKQAELGNANNAQEKLDVLSNIECAKISGGIIAGGCVVEQPELVILPLPPELPSPNQETDW
jgi:hypothetical protein